MSLYRVVAKYELKHQVLSLVQCKKNQDLWKSFVFVIILIKKINLGDLLIEIAQKFCFIPISCNILQILTPFHSTSIAYNQKDIISFL